ncbi:MAG: oxidoreductase [Rickettsiales bacterium]|nr:oxidoreductase [Rickettsiales bacterium]
MRVGIIGCGNISETYFESQILFNNFNIIACSDINFEVAKKSAEKYNIKALSVEEILSSQEVDLIINLTIPSAHKEIIIKSLNAGKHCFSEKPLAINLKEGMEIFELANLRKLYVGSAPDTFLGAAGQKARKIIEEDQIGNIVLGTFNLMSHGMEDWHPNPDFFFKRGAGPVFDVGIYYITQLINLLGPVKSVNAISTTPETQRTITSEERYGEKILVETPTTFLGSLNFHNSTIIQFFCSWDVWNHKHANIELYGNKGSLILPDPNYFSGDILISKRDQNWEGINNDKMLLGIPNKEDLGLGKMVANYRGVGLSDMIQSITSNKLPRCSIDLSLHVLDVMEGILYSSKNSSIYLTKTSCEKPNILSEEEIKKILI